MWPIRWPRPRRTKKSVSQLPGFLLPHLIHPGFSHYEPARPVVEPNTARWHRASRRLKEESELSLDSIPFSYPDLLLKWFLSFCLCLRIKRAIELKQRMVTSHIWEPWTPVEGRLVTTCCSSPFYSIVNPTLQFLSAKTPFILHFERISLAHFVFL